MTKPVKSAVIVLASLAVFLLLGIAALGSRLLDNWQTIRFDAAGHDLATLRPAMNEFLAGLRGRATITFFVSAREKMPAAMKDIEQPVRAMLAAMKRQAPDRFDYLVIDPDADPEQGAGYASRKAASPVKLPKIWRDASSEQAVWCSLVISYGEFRSALINGISGSDLPRLQDLIIEHFREMVDPRTAVIAVAAPNEGFEQFINELSARELTRIERIDFNATPVIPPGADGFIWIQPGQCGKRWVDALHQFVDSGKMVAISGTHYGITCEDSGLSGGYRCQARPALCDWDRLLRPWGLIVEPWLVLDPGYKPEAPPVAQPVPLPREAVSQIFIPPMQCDIRVLSGFTIGQLHAGTLMALRPDPAMLDRTGFSAAIVATSSPATVLAPAPAGPFDDSLALSGELAAKQPWAVFVTPHDPWRGSLLAIGSSDLFRDGVFGAEGNANRLFLTAAMNTMTAKDRLARIRTPSYKPESLPKLSLRQRMFWRITAVFFLPLLLLALAIHRRGAFSTPRPTSPWRKFLVVGIAGFAALLVLSGLTSQSKSLFVDLTPGNSNRIHPAVSRILAPVNTDIRVEMVISERNAMPARLKHLESGLRNQLRQLNIPFSVIRPEDLDAAGQSALRAAGLGPFSTMSVSDDEQSVAEIWSAMRVMCQGRETVIPQIDQQSLTDFQFLISAAVDRCRAGNQGPVVGFLSDLPRLSAAEAHQDYTQMGYIAPEGTDVYSEARRLLERYGYQVVYINPKAPQLPAQMDALVWLQPRVAGPLIPAFSDYLARGGKAFVALQQYNVQQRQYRGAGYQTVYWPQPQNHRMNDYLQLIGILQTGEKAGDKPAEVLFDANYGRLALDTRIFQRSQFREKDRQEVARPFLIRAVGPGLSKESPVTARLGALLFIWGNRFQLDESNLTTAGLRVKTLVTTSPQVWTYDWVGGWIPETALIPPSTFLGTPLTLAVQVDGIFPRAVPKEPSNPSDPFDLEPRSTGDSPGQLILAGCSEMFKNNALFHPDYQHQQLLLNAAAYLTRAPDLADLQARHTAPQMFSRPEPGAALLARALVIVSGPALFLLFGFWRLFRSRQALPLPGAEK